MMYKFLRYFIYIAILLLAVFQASCNDVRFTDSDKEVLTESIYVTPEKFNGAVHIFFAPQKNVYLELNDNVKFSAVFSLNGDVLDADLATNYYQSVLWKINGEKFNIPTFRYTFREPGINTCTLLAIDNFGDSIYDTVNVYVNTPTHIYLNGPRDKYNQVNEAFDDTISLRWEIQGLDSWETANCSVYGSTDRKSVWKNFLGEADCNESINLIGPSYKDYLIDLPSDYSETYYWGVVLKVRNERGVSEIDTSNIFSFSTKTPDSTISVLHIPIIYDKMSVFENPITIITITNFKGDTIAQDFSYFSNDYTTTYIKPQTGVKVHLEDELHPEFRASDFTINIPEQSSVVADTVYFTDKIAPVIWPISQEREFSTNFKFILSDKGSGINPNKIQIYKDDQDEIKGTYNDTLLTIPSIRDSSYTLTIIVFDKAGNTNTPTYWKVDTEGEKQILTGPFSNREEIE